MRHRKLKTQHFRQLRPSGAHHSVVQLLDANGLSLHVARYLYAMQKEDLRDLYHAFMNTQAVAEDLLTLTRSERISVVAELWHWSVNDVRRVDLISAN